MKPKDITFDKETFNKKFNSIKSNKRKMLWIKDLIDYMRSIYRDMSDEQIEKLLKKYKLLKAYPAVEVIPNETSKFPRYDNSIYKDFILYVEDTFIPFLSLKKFNLGWEIRKTDILKRIADGSISDEEKYPTYDYRYSTIKNYGEDIFTDINALILYYKYVIHQFRREYHNNMFVFNWRDKNVPGDMELLQHEIEFLESKKVLEGKIENNETEYIKIQTGIGRTKTAKTIKRFDLTVLPGSHKPKWIGTTKQLDILLYQLQINCFIENKIVDDPTYNHYKSVFIDKNNKSMGSLDPLRIIWLEDLKDLIYLVRELSDKESSRVLADNKKWKRISNVFLNSEGNLLDSYSMGSYNLNIEKIENIEKLDKIVKQIRNAKSKIV